MPREILLGLTTTPRSDWRDKCREIDELGLEQLALFPTYLNIEEREELYGLLERTGLKRIPHVHLRGQDMEAWEMELFEKKYQARAYNIHQAASGYPALEPYRHKVYVENQWERLQEELVNGYAGLCLDFSHLEDIRVRLKTGGQPLLGKRPVGCCHVSAIRNLFGLKFSDHYLNDLHELDYLVKYRQHLPELVSLELENALAEQLQAKAYLEGVLRII